MVFSPLYKQVEKHVTSLILTKRWKPGDMLPNEFQLAEEFGVSQGTVRKALNSLTDAKILKRRQGIGTFVNQYSADSAFSTFNPYRADHADANLSRPSLINMDKVSAPEQVVAALGLNPEDQVWHLLRQRAIEDRPVMLENIYLPVSLFSELNTNLMPDSLYHCYQQHFGITVSHTIDKIKAVNAEPAWASTLAVEPFSPVLLVTRLAKGLDGNAVEYRETFCHSDKLHLLIERN